HNFPIVPSVDTLSFYTVYMCHHIRPSSVDSYLSGICNQLEPLYPEVRTLRRHHLVTRTLAGCKRMFSTPANRKAALEPHHLLTLLQHFPPDSHNNRLFRALALSGFFALHRLGELVWPDDSDLRSWRKVISRVSVTLTSDSYGYTLPSHKADRLFAGSSILISDTFAPDGIAPSTVFRDYLSSRDGLFPLQPALWLTEDGQVPTRSWFISRLHRAIPDQNISGHSLRAGGATFFASIGWPDDRIQ
ncbi:uncharacterized protein PHACADRAFT_70463, partial [Phanerochaete carnosa HHB-10118-sp]